MTRMHDSKSGDILSLTRKVMKSRVRAFSCSCPIEVRSSNVEKSAAWLLSDLC